MNETKNRRLFNKEESRVLRQAHAAHKAGKTLAEVAKQFHDMLPGRSIQSVISALSRMNVLKKAARVRKRPGRILRGSRYYTKEGLEAARQNGARRLGGVKQRLIALGLTPEQVAQAFSGKQPSLSKEQVKRIEDRAAQNEQVFFMFERRGTDLVAIEVTADEVVAGARPAPEKANGFHAEAKDVAAAA